MVGDDSRIWIPSLGRERAQRLRGIRLIHTHLKREPLTEEDLSDLTLLRLDAACAITMDEHGLPEQFHLAYIAPGMKPGYTLEKPYRPGQLPEDLEDRFAELDTQFRRFEEVTRSAGGMPRAILVGVYTRESRQRRTPEDSIAELKELCHTAGVDPVQSFIQNRSHLDPSTVLGSGKIKEIAIAGVQENADTLVFDMELSPAQAIRLSTLTELKILDRTQLILDIFARNARSRDGKLQVELAQLRYLKGRLSEKDDNMSRLTGGIGARGPGETKLEIGRRRVEDRIRRLEKELTSVKKRRLLNRRRRDDSAVPVCSIVGYTNAGKSTLLNKLTHSEVTQENRLFATLDPTTRRLRFPEEREIILTDTVGFIHDLPPELKKAFQATLEELADSDLLLHCIDASDPAREEKVRDVEEILNELGLSDIPTLRVYNKLDRLPPALRKELENDARPDRVYVSAREGINLKPLLDRLEELTSGAVHPSVLAEPG
tara:strand:- start:173638 stop:175101 length:1464 start_codon:yes stop_codon:yes gene_type:complete